MLQLLESAGHPRSRPAQWAALSGAAHAALITLVGMAGAREVVGRPAPVAPVERVYYSAPAPAPRPEPLPAAMSPVAAPMAAPRFEIPRTVLPSVGEVVERFVTSRANAPLTPGAHGTPSPQSLQPAVGLGSGGVYAEHAVDRAVVPWSGNRSPEYPALLRASGVDGEVIVRFVVDATGRVEPGSVEVVRASHTLFAEAVKRWLLRNRYSAATLGGSPVRQMVEQRVEFTLSSG